MVFLGWFYCAASRLLCRSLEPLAQRLTVPLSRSLEPPIAAAHWIGPHSLVATIVRSGPPSLLATIVRRGPPSLLARIVRRGPHSLLTTIVRRGPHSLLATIVRRRSHSLLATIVCCHELPPQLSPQPPLHRHCTVCCASLWLLNIAFFIVFFRGQDLAHWAGSPERCLGFSGYFRALGGRTWSIGRVHPRGAWGSGGIWGPLGSPRRVHPTGGGAPGGILGAPGAPELVHPRGAGGSGSILGAPGAPRRVHPRGGGAPGVF